MGSSSINSGMVFLNGNLLHSTSTSFCYDSHTAPEAMNSALELEKHVNQALLDLHTTADKHNDAQV